MNPLCPIAEQLSVPSGAYPYLIVAGLISIVLAILGTIPMKAVQVQGPNNTTITVHIPLINLKRWQKIIFWIIGIILLLLGLILASPKVIQAAIECRHYTITSPGKDSSVPVLITVKGTAPQPPANQELWLLVQSGNGYFPQGDAKDPKSIVVSQDGEWNVGAIVGNDTEPKGTPHTLHLVLVDTNSPAKTAIDTYFKEGIIKGYKPFISLPVGIHPITQVTVIHQPLPYAITPPKEDSSVGVQILVHGTAPAPPQGKELWLLVETQGVSGYYPQGDAINPQPLQVSSDGQWNATVYAGTEKDAKGTKYVLHLALVDTNSPGKKAIVKYFTEGRPKQPGQRGNYKAIPPPLPKGIDIVAQVTVQRA